MPKFIVELDAERDAALIEVIKKKGAQPADEPPPDPTDPPGNPTKP